MAIGNLFSEIYPVRAAMLERAIASQLLGEARDGVRASVLADAPPTALHYLVLKVTNRCNSNCVYCGHAANAPQRELKRDVDLGVARSIFREAAELGCTAISIDGGEPLLRKDLPEIIAACSAEGIVPVLMTNALLMPRRWREIGEAGLKYVIISIDSLDAASYESLRGVKLSGALEGLAAAERMRDTFGDVKIHVTSVLTRHNADEIVPAVRALSRRGIALQVSPVHIAPDAGDSLDTIEASRIDRVVADLLRMKDDGYLIGNSRGFLEHLPAFFDGNRLVPHGFACVGGYTHLFIDPYGDVRPCYDPAFGVLGNINTEPLASIWLGDAMADLRRRMLRAECQGCWLLCTGEVSMLMADKL